MAQSGDTADLLAAGLEPGPMRGCPLLCVRSLDGQGGDFDSTPPAGEAKSNEIAYKKFSSIGCSLIASSFAGDEDRVCGNIVVRSSERE